MEGRTDTTKTASMLLQGNEAACRILRSVVRLRRVANAYLLKGPPGSPKEVLAERFARSLVCDSEMSIGSGESCDECWSCRAATRGEHPDLLEVGKDGSAIKIKRSHEIQKEALARPYHSKRRVFYIKDAESMTVEASNALLKILEEPPAFVTFVLTATNVHAIPETIVSRCQVISVRQLPTRVLCQVLVSEHGADVAAAREAASYAGGNIEKALFVLNLGREDGPRGVLEEILAQSPIDLALKYSKGDPGARVDSLTALEIELVGRLRSETSASQDTTAGLHRALKSLLTARARLKARCNAFLTMAVLFTEISRALAN